MEKLDLKDRKILYELDLHSRQSFRSIGRKVGLSKDVIASRVKKLQEKGIIKFISAEIDWDKLGYSYPRYYYKLQFITPEIKKEIIDCYTNYKHVRTVSSNHGSNDLCVIYSVKNLSEFYNTWGETYLNKYRDYFAKQLFSIITLVKLYKSTFLIEVNKSKNSERFKYNFGGSGKRVEIDNFDLQLLQLIATNARMPMVEIVKKMNSTAKTINNRIKNLIKQGVIQGFSICIDYSKIGYHYFKADVVLKDPKKLPDLIKIIEKNPNLITIQKAIGYVDVEFSFILKNADQLLKIMEELSTKLPNVIKDYTYFYHVDIHKFDTKPVKKI